MPGREEQTTKPTNPVAAGKKRGETERRASKGEEETLSLSLSRLLLLLSFLF